MSDKMEEKTKALQLENDKLNQDLTSLQVKYNALVDHLETQKQDIQTAKNTMREYDKLQSRISNLETELSEKRGYIQAITSMNQYLIGEIE